MKSILLILPAYNEEDAIGDVLDNISQLPLDFDVLVIDDGSRDGTSRIAEERGAIVLKHQVNMGIGASTQTGFKLAFQRGYKIVVRVDADGQHPVETIPELVKSLEKGADIVVGRGLDEVEEFEIYDDALIFYSLGSFVSENKLATELNSNAEGLIVGVWVEPYRYELYFFRVLIENGYPKFMDYSNNEEFFGEYFSGVTSEWENPELGVIHIAR